MHCDGAKTAHWGDSTVSPWTLRVGSQKGDGGGRSGIGGDAEGRGVGCGLTDTRVDDTLDVVSVSGNNDVDAPDDRSVGPDSFSTAPLSTPQAKSV